MDVVFAPQPLHLLPRPRPDPNGRPDPSPSSSTPARRPALDKRRQPVALEHDRREVLGQDLDVELLLRALGEQGVVCLGVGLE